MKFLLSLLLNVLGIAFLIAVIIIPVMPDFKNDARVDSALGAVLCNPGEKLVREPIPGVLSRLGIAMTPYCTGAGQRRDVTTRWLLIGLGGFGVSMLFGTVFEIMLVLNAIRRGVVRAVSPRQSVAGVTMPITPPLNPEASLSDKLKQLDDAQKAGLITYDEYDRMRGDLFNGA